jgi:hypothetical protein
VLFLQRIAQPVEVGPIILFAEEARFAVVPALYDVHRYAIKMDARAPGHAAIMAK